MAVRTILNKDELIRDFVSFYNSDKAGDEKLMLNSMRSVMTELGKYLQERVKTLDYDEAIQLGNFIKIYINKRPPRLYKNPQTGEPIQKGEARIVKARVMPALRGESEETEE